MSTTHQARWLRQLTWETKTLTYATCTHAHNNTNKTDSRHGAGTLPAKERNNHNDTTCYITSHGRQGHSLPQGHPPHTTSKLPLQTNSVLSIVMSTSSKRHWQENPQSNRLRLNITCTLNPKQPLYTMTVSYLKLDILWISLHHFLQEKQETQHSYMSVWRYTHL